MYKLVTWLDSHVVQAEKPKWLRLWLIFFIYHNGMIKLEFEKAAALNEFLYLFFLNYFLMLHDDVKIFFLGGGGCRRRI